METVLSRGIDKLIDTVIDELDEKVLPMSKVADVDNRTPVYIENKELNLVERQLQTEGTTQDTTQVLK
jgi:hypothetical protein